jgi:integrase
MSRRKRGPSPRFRVGRVSVYRHHGAWWLYYRDGGRPVRRKVAQDRSEAEQVAAQVNAQLTSGAPTLLAFSPVGVAELRQQFLDYHEHVLHSSLATVRRYRAATHYLEAFALGQPRPAQAAPLTVGGSHPSATLRGRVAEGNPLPGLPASSAPQGRRRSLNPRGVGAVGLCLPWGLPHPPRGHPRGPPLPGEPVPGGTRSSR